MTTTLSSLQTRLRSLLMDTGAQIWEDAALAEGLRLALGEYGLAGGQAAALSGLDGALVTSLDPLHESLIVWGAAGCCALARAVDRAERFQPGSDPGALKAWGEQRLKEFKAMLGAVFPGYLPALAAGTAQADPAKSTAEVALLNAQAAALTGQEQRAAAAAEQTAQDRLEEAARRAELRRAAEASWGGWDDRRDPHYPADYERS